MNYPPTSASLDDVVAWLLDNFAFLPAGHGAAIPIKESQVAPIGMTAFKHLFTHYVFYREPIKKLNERAPKRVFVTDRWLMAPGRHTVHGVQCRPDMVGPMFTDPANGLMYVNSWRAPVHPRSGGSTAIFHDFVGGLLVDDRERGHFMDKWACKAQHPEIRGLADVLVAHKRQGTGRGLLFELIAATIGQQHTTTVAFGDLFERFNEHMAKLVVMVNETRGAADDYRTTKRMEMMEALKQQIDPRPQRVVVNFKWGLKVELTTFSWFLFATNHLDALPLQAEDRRFNVYRCGVARPRPFYAKLDAALRDPKAVGKWRRELMDRDITKHDPFYAIETDIGHQMRDAGQSEIEEAIAEAMQALAQHEIAQMNQVLRAVEVFMRGTTWATHQWQWIARRQLAGDMPRVIRPKGEKKVYALAGENAAKMWRDADPAMVERQIDLVEATLKKLGAIPRLDILGGQGFGIPNDM